MSGIVYTILWIERKHYPFYWHIKNWQSTNITRKRQLSRATVYKRLSEFFVCTSRMSGIVHTILRIERKHLALYTAIKDD